MNYKKLTRELTNREKIFWNGVFTGMIGLTIFLILCTMAKITFDYFY